MGKGDTATVGTRFEKIKVQCTFVIEVEVEVPVDFTDHDIQFMIEENSCPGTGQVGKALCKHIDKHLDADTCWACALQGENKIL